MKLVWLSTLGIGANVLGLSVPPRACCLLLATWFGATLLSSLVAG